jgi:hypothetical protein
MKSSEFERKIYFSGDVCFPQHKGIFPSNRTQIPASAIPFLQKRAQATSCLGTADSSDEPCHPPLFPDFES